MGYIREPKNVDLVVGPSEFTEETNNSITRAIKLYKNTGKKPIKVEVITQGSSIITDRIGRTKTIHLEKVISTRKRSKI